MGRIGLSDELFLPKDTEWEGTFQMKQKTLINKKENPCSEVWKKQWYPWKYGKGRRLLNSSYQINMKHSNCAVYSQPFDLISWVSISGLLIMRLLIMRLLIMRLLIMRLLKYRLPILQFSGSHCILVSIFR